MKSEGFKEWKEVIKQQKASGMFPYWQILGYIN